MQHLDEALEVGDYLQVAGERMTQEGRRRGEGCARIEWVEHIAEPSFLAPESTNVFTRVAAKDVIVAVLCQGMPGPVLLRGGDHRVLTAVNMARRDWDAEHPSWPARQRPVFVGGRVPDGPHWSREEDDPEDDLPGQGGKPSVSTRRAAAFGKPASALMVGDYLQIHAVRFPETDMGADEGFHRVEWIGHLPEGRAAGLLVEPPAQGPVTLVSVHGLSGMLVLPEKDVQVLVRPNVERASWDEQDFWHRRPFYELVGVLDPDVTKQREADAGLRPQASADEDGLYPSMFTDPDRRALHLDGETGVRPVPAAALPWPHGLFKCPYADRAKRLAQTYPGGRREDQTAHAELFSQLGEKDFAACPYHRGDWRAIAAAALAFAEVDEDADPERAQQLYAMEQLDPRDQKWARDLLADHIWWDEGDTSLTNGQHRLCAMRAAGVPAVPVYGRYLPGRAPVETGDARTHARGTVETFWTERLAALWGPGPWARRLGPVFARHHFLRWLLPRPDRHRD